MVKQVRAARTRQALIVAAAESFADEGYAQASLPAISKRAGVSAGALHFHFASKDELAREVERAAVNSVAELAERCRFTAATSLQSLIHATTSLLLAVTRDPVVRAGFQLSGDPSRKNGAEMVRWWQQQVRDLVVEARDAGELADDVSAEAATMVIVAATVGFEALGTVDRDYLSAERMSEFWTFILPRLAASPASVPASAANGALAEGHLE
ncbi:ScbR family autoregulator-binding transcription factor [Streptomyces sp. NPDC001480]|uniref:ScbR family autoregulator-binding transcription factor n=1 Tax=Streptomyces sp. NPDC001480 TaxID=3364577 RepID=UPI0036C004A4